MATTLVKYAKINGSKDNISVIVLKFWSTVPLFPINHKN
jgi:serine/threonine protein phosphatase PrpC